MFLEYWQNEEATRRKFIGDWLLTGDLAQKDEDGYFWFNGRTDDVITSAGYRIGPAEIEDCLLKHPAVGLAPDLREMREQMALELPARFDGHHFLLSCLAQRVHHFAEDIEL